jgi:hypothetical protein
MTTAGGGSGGGDGGVGGGSTLSVIMAAGAGGDGRLRCSNVSAWWQYLVTENAVPDVPACVKADCCQGLLGIARERGVTVEGMPEKPRAVTV